MLSLTRADKLAISDVLNYANRNKISLDQQTKIFQGKVPPPGDNPRYLCALRAGKRHYRVVFTYGEQPVGWTRHLSISVNDKKQIALDDLNAILRAFGFRWAKVEKLEPGYYGSVQTYIDPQGYFNCIELIDDKTHQEVKEKGGMSIVTKVGNSAYIISDPQQPSA